MTGMYTKSPLNNDPVSTWPLLLDGECNSLKLLPETIFRKTKDLRRAASNRRHSISDVRDRVRKLFSRATDQRTWRLIEAAIAIRKGGIVLALVHFFYYC